MRRWTTIALALLSALVVQSQETFLSWDFSLNAGYMMPNNSAYRDNASSTFGLDATCWWRGLDSSYWRVLQGYPSFGIKVSYAHIPRSLAGDRIGLTGHLRQPLFGSRYWEWSAGLGVSAYTKPRSITGDTSNIFIGSLINCLIDLGITYRPVDNLFLSARVLHTSNGMLMWPNMGLNYFQVDVGYTFGNYNADWKSALQRRRERYPEMADTCRMPKSEFGIAFSPGTVMARDLDFEGYYFCYDVSLYYQKYTSSTFALGAAVDFWYNFCDTRHLNREDGVYNIPLYLSAMFVFEHFWGPVSLKAGIGPNIVVSPQVTIPFYERVGAYYNFGRNCLGVAVNAHGGRVEFIEWTYGRRFPVW